MKRVTILTAALLAAASGTASAQELSGFTKIVTETELLSVQSTKLDFDANGLAVGPTGTIYAIDSDNNTPTFQSVLRIVPGAPNTIGLMADNAAMVAAIEAVNGTTTITSFSPRVAGVLANGNIVIGGFTSATNADTLLILSDAAPATITVLHTGINGADSAIDGIDAMTIIGNTIYVSTNENNGNAVTADAIVTFDGTAAGPAATGTILVNKATLEAAFGVAGDSFANALTNDGTDIYALISGTGTAPDLVGRITTAGVCSVHLTKAGVLNALTALDATTVDVGYNAIGIDNEGTIYLSNSAGTAAGAYDDSLIAVGNISGGVGTVRTITKANLGTALGINSGSTPFVGGDSLVYDAANNRMLFSEGREAPASNEGIISFPKAFTSNVADWSMF